MSAETNEPNRETQSRTSLSLSVFYDSHEERWVYLLQEGQRQRSRGTYPNAADAAIRGAEALTRAVAGAWVA